MSGSPAPIYDPDTGNADGTGKTQFPGNIIPAYRFDPVVLKIIPNIPATNVGGASADINNFYINDANVYNLQQDRHQGGLQHYLETCASPGRFGYQPYYDFPAANLRADSRQYLCFFDRMSVNGNYVQHGAGLWRFPVPEVM